MSPDEADSVVYQYLLVEMHGARTNVLGLWSSSIALTILCIASLSGPFQAVGLFAVPIIALLLIFLFKYMDYLDTVKGVTKSYATGSRRGSLREALRLEVFPKEVRITSYRPEEENDMAAS